ncbi:MAG TPA: pectinesterase family protein [Planctomycetota bacterium]|nr:pectinesterase family protein [Planctomycetota bacterium]
MRRHLILCIVCAFVFPRARAEQARTLVVAADKSGDFVSVQAAIDSIPANSAAPTIICIKPGTYKERISVPRGKPHVSFIGEDAATTVLTEGWYSGTLDENGKPAGTFKSASTFIFAEDFTAENITFENTFGRIAPNNQAQALAIHISGDRATFRKCRFLGWQDTVLADAGRHYFEDCFIAGHVDFIFGAAVVWFEKCTIHCRASGYITAASTPAEQPFGFVFHRCRVTSDDQKPSFLGRPWRSHAAVTWLNTELCAQIQPAGWDNWSDASREKTARFAEYQSTGPGANAARRATWARQLSDEGAKTITAQFVLKGTDGWNPANAKDAK